MTINNSFDLRLQFAPDRQVTSSLLSANCTLFWPSIKKKEIDPDATQPVMVATIEFDRRVANCEGHILRRLRNQILKDNEK